MAIAGLLLVLAKRGYQSDKGVARDVVGVDGLAERDVHRVVRRAGVAGLDFSYLLRRHVVVALQIGVDPLLGLVHVVVDGQRQVDRAGQLGGIGIFDHPG